MSASCCIHKFHHQLVKVIHAYEINSHQINFPQDQLQ